MSLATARASRRTSSPAQQLNEELQKTVQLASPIFAPLQAKLPCYANTFEVALYTRS